MSIPQTSGIYKWTCTPTKKIYIGSAVNLRTRWREHRNLLRNQTHSNNYFQHAWDKYGEDAFVFEVLELVFAPFLLEREQYYLDKLKPFRSRGFNIYTKAGSPYGRVVSDESRRKMSESQKRRAANGEARIWTQEQRDEHSRRLKGRPLSPEHKENIRQALKGRILGNREITRQKQLARAKPKVVKEHIKRQGASLENLAYARTFAVEASSKTYLLISPTGESILVKNLMKFARENGINYHGLRKVLSGIRPKYKGWGCKYID